MYTIQFKYFNEQGTKRELKFKNHKTEKNIVLSREDCHKLKYC